MKIVLKIGGAALDDAKLRRECAAGIAALARDHQVAVVHGGGAALTRMLARLGIKSEFVGGLRVTDAETRDVALMVLAGAVNKQLVAELAHLAVPDSAEVRVGQVNGVQWPPSRPRCDANDSHSR